MSTRFITQIENRNKIEKVPGKYTPIQFQGEGQILEEILTIPGKKTNLPLVIFFTKSRAFLGITLARQSSDLLSLLAKKLIQKTSASQWNLIQYQFPKDLNSLKLILFAEWAQPDDFEKCSAQLAEFQAEFLEKMQKIVDSAFNSK